MTERHDVERAQDAERELERARTEGKPLARDVLERFMLLFAGLASRFQPGTMAAPNKHADDTQFRFWSERAVDAAKALAIYQSPRLQALAVAAPPHERERVTRIRIDVFSASGRLVRRVGEDEDGQRYERDFPSEPPTIEGEVERASRPSPLRSPSFR